MKQTKGLLSVDIGYKHMACCFTNNFSIYNVYLFEVDASQTVQDRIQSFKENMDNILTLIGKLYVPDEEEADSIVDYMTLAKKNIVKVIIEQQVQQNIPCQNIQYILCTYFQMNNIKYCLQPARMKYKIFHGHDSSNFKQLGVMYIQKDLDKIKVYYRNQRDRQVIKHNWMSQELCQWLQDNKIDKFDEISDIVLMLRVELMQMNDKRQ